MTRRGKIRDVPASIRQRLLNLAREQGIRFNSVLQRYAAERFLYRLSVSGEVNRLTLKGAALFRIWTRQEMRPTRDVDFLSAGPEDHAAIRAALETVCCSPCPEDGVAFDSKTMRVASIREEQPHGGVRARIPGRLGLARLALQVDIGFGDVITPGPEEQDYPTLLDLPTPRLWTYPRETVVAEKFKAMVSRDETNSRVKDLWDIACLSRCFAFDGETLRTAISATFRRRGSSFVSERPLALLPSYYNDTARAQHWQVLQRQLATDTDGPARLVDTGEELRRFLGPVCDSLIEERPFTLSWPVRGPWRPGIPARTGGEGGDWGVTERIEEVAPAAPAVPRSATRIAVERYEPGCSDKISTGRYPHGAGS